MKIQEIITESHTHSKQEVNYVAMSTSSERCSECVHWRAPDKCEIVTGAISPSGWCKYFKSNKPD